MIRILINSCRLSVASLMLTSCSYNESVPDSLSIDGCYYTKHRMVMMVGDRRFRSSNGLISGRISRGMGSAGSYVVFEPAIRLLSNSNDETIIVNSDLPRSHILSIIRRDVIYIRMPTDPLGEALLERRPC